MKTVGVKGLKNRTTQILRDVRESGEEYTVTLNGKLVALLKACAKPVETAEERSARALAWLEQWHAFGDILSREWPEGVSAAEAIAEQRR